MKFIGTTETYDPCFVKDWEKRLKSVNLIITKELTDEMIEKLTRPEIMRKCILHHTVTGWGSTTMEPGVKDYKVEYEQYKKLIDAGFPIMQYVLRIDPIFPTETGLENVNKVLSQWLESPQGRLRLRFSILDIYKHVRSRLSKAGIAIPSDWTEFNAPDEYIEKVIELLEGVESYFHIETCAERNKIIPIRWQIGCASIRDILALGKDPENYGLPLRKQRPTCLCLAKKQILGVKPGRCPHNCAYCYWR